MRANPNRLALLVSFLVLAALPLACGGGGGGGDDGPVGSTYTVSGTVFGSAVEGVLIQMTGDAITAATTDFDGTYTFSELPAGRYYLTPYLEGVTFAPLSRTANVIDQDLPGIDFTSAGAPPPVESSPPPDPQSLIVARNLDGLEWLTTSGIDNNGGLGDELGVNNYYVSDVSSGWGTVLNPVIGSTTDIGHWWLWFIDTTLIGPAPGTPRRDDITQALFTADYQTASYVRIPNPGGANDIVLLASGTLNSEVLNVDAAEPPANLQGQQASDPAHTLPNCMQIYRDLLPYFMAQPGKLFVIVTAPPRASANTLLTSAFNARILNDWLVNGWLQEQNWEGKNVAVFDRFNVLTDADNHHRVNNGKVEHVTNPDGNDFAAYAQGGTDIPNQAGNLKATAEFVPLLNVFWHRWQNWNP